MRDIDRHLYILWILAGLMYVVMAFTTRETVLMGMRLAPVSFFVLPVVGSLYTLFCTAYSLLLLFRRHGFRDLLRLGTLIFPILYFYRMLFTLVL